MDRGLSEEDRATLDEAVDQFAASVLARQLQSQGDAAGRCKPAALAALGLLRECGLDARLVRFDRPGEHHWVVAVGDTAVDPSARQFPAHADVKVPHVRGLAELRTEWAEEQVMNPADLWTMKSYGAAWVPPWNLARNGLPPRPPTLDDIWPGS